MKMTQSHYEELQSAIAGAAACSGQTPKTYAARGLNEERYRWDMLWASKFQVSKLYNAGLNDSHIDTALRRIVAQIFES